MDRKTSQELISLAQQRRKAEAEAMRVGRLLNALIASSDNRENAGR